MEPCYVKIDNFYADPVAMRKIALEAEYHPIKQSTKHFNRNAPWPGKISKKCFKPKDLDMKVSKALGKLVSSTPERAGISGFFRISHASDTPGSFCHADNITEITQINQYVGVLYLSPDEHCSGLVGTNFYRHKETSISFMKTLEDSKKLERDFDNPSAWELFDKTEMKFNTMVIYDACLIHGFGPMFGDSDETARLTQIFTFNEL